MSLFKHDRLDPTQFVPAHDRPTDQRAAMALEFIAGALGRLERLYTAQLQQQGVLTEAGQEKVTELQPQRKLDRAA